MSLKIICEELTVLGHADLSEILAKSGSVDIDITNFDKAYCESFINMLTKNLNDIIKMTEKDMLDMGGDNPSKNEIKEFIDPVKELKNGIESKYNEFKSGSDSVVISLDVADLNPLYRSLLVKAAKDSLQKEYNKLEKMSDADDGSEKFKKMNSAKDAMKNALQKLN